MYATTLIQVVLKSMCRQHSLESGVILEKTARKAMSGRHTKPKSVSSFLVNSHIMMILNSFPYGSVNKHDDGNDDTMALLSGGKIWTLKISNIEMLPKVKQVV